MLAIEVNIIIPKNINMAKYYNYRKKIYYVRDLTKLKVPKNWY